MGCHAFLQGIFPTQGSSPRLKLLIYVYSTSAVYSSLSLCCISNNLCLRFLKNAPYEWKHKHVVLCIISVSSVGVGARPHGSSNICGGGGCFVVNQMVSLKIQWLLYYRNCDSALRKESSFVLVYFRFFSSLLSMSDTRIYPICSSFIFFPFLTFFSRGKKNAYTLKSRQLEKTKLKGRRCFHV